MNVMFNVSAPGWKTPPGKRPSLAGGLSLVEVWGLSLAAAVQFSCQSRNGMSPRVLALRWKCLSKCQDLTIYPQMRPLGRGATTQTLWGRVTRSRSSWRLGMKNKALGPWWFIADPLARIKNGIAGYFSLLNCHENNRGDAPTPPRH